MISLIKTWWWRWGQVGVSTALVIPVLRIFIRIISMWKVWL